MRATVFRHTNFEGLGSVSQALEKAGVDYRFIDTFREDFEDFDPDTSEILIVLGGAMGVYQADDYPFLYDEMKHIEKRIEKDLPVLGICLGAQMMAKVLGSEVYPGDPGGERGWFNLDITEDGLSTPVNHFCKTQTKMVCWHGDTFDIPKGAKRLASSEMYENQAFSLSENILGVQFHPEATPHILHNWFVGAAPRVASGEIDLNKLRDDTKRYSCNLMTQTERFIIDWVKGLNLEK
jgi:GMP synthase (glutamine-hydrolysing)